MKSTHKTQRFDYKKIEQDGNPRSHLEFFGIHRKSGRLHIDTKRFKKILLQDGVQKFLQDGMFKNRTTTYLIPAKVHRHDYKVNIVRDLLSNLQKDWNCEFKPLLTKIETPDEVYDKSRMNMVSMTSCSDDYDEIEVESRLEAIKRIPKYDSVILSLYCQFICKICAEVDRFTLILLKSLGYSQKDFGMRDFRAFTDGLKHQNHANLIEKLSGFNAFDMLHRINNFLKHNTLFSYNELKKKFPENVKSNINGKPYESGMFAGDWIVVKKGYIDRLFQKLNNFFEDYCHTFVGEDLEGSKWNYDDYFRDVFREIIVLSAYYGV